MNTSTAIKSDRLRPNLPSLKANIPEVYYQQQNTNMIKENFQEIQLRKL